MRNLLDELADAVRGLNNAMAMRGIMPEYKIVFYDPNALLHLSHLLAKDVEPLISYPGNPMAPGEFKLLGIEFVHARKSERPPPVRESRPF